MKKTKIAKGNYYRLRTKKWLESLGFLVENLERSQRIQTVDKQTGKEHVLFIKRDIWGADLIARDRDHILFVQVKTNKAHISQGMKELNRGPWPTFVARWVVYWPPRRLMKQGPDITEVGEEDADGS